MTSVDSYLRMAADAIERASDQDENLSYARQQIKKAQEYLRQAAAATYLEQARRGEFDNGPAKGGV